MTFHFSTEKEGTMPINELPGGFGHGITPEDWAKYVLTHLYFQSVVLASGDRAKRPEGVRDLPSRSQEGIACPSTRHPVASATA